MLRGARRRRRRRTRSSRRRRRRCRSAALAEACGGRRPLRRACTSSTRCRDGARRARVPRRRRPSDARARARALCEALGKTAVVVPDIPGFVVNRLLFPYLFCGRRPARADRHWRRPTSTRCMTLGAGHPMGPLALLDFVGLDVADGDRRGDRRRRAAAAHDAGRRGRAGPQERPRLPRLRARHAPGRRAMSAPRDHASCASPLLDERRARRARRGPQGRGGRLGRRRPGRPRGGAVALSGQELVPVLELARRRGRGRLDGDPRWLEADHPSRRCGPRAGRPRAADLIAVEWFNDVWKAAPNAIDGELASARARTTRGSRAGAEMDALPLFEALLARPRLPARRRARRARRLRASRS